MTSEKRLPFTQWANINQAERFISVLPLSGYRSPLFDDNGHVIYLPPDASDIALGRALLEMLDRSQFIWPPDDPDFFKWQRYEQCYRNWQINTMRRYHYKTKRDLYKNMNWCRVNRSEGKISIEPHKRDKPEYWEDLPEEKTVIIPATRDAEVVGTALRLALDRCE